jgi:THO complex subunit 2
VSIDYILCVLFLQSTHSIFSYKQRRFNLFREESEGYAKLITELNQDINDQEGVVSTLEMIKSLIGCFNLDPNRVLDIILESFETRPENEKLFIPLLQTYMHDGNIICEVLGYKYRHFAGQRTPESLYTVTALLLQHGVIVLDNIYTWVSLNILDHHFFNRIICI